MNRLPIAEPIVFRFAWMLIHSLWQGIATVAAAAGILRLMSRADAQARYLVVCAAMVALPLTSLLTYSILAPEPTSALPIAPSSQFSALASNQPPITSAALSHPGFHFDRQWILQAAVMCWLIGVIALAVRHLFGWLWLMRCARGRPLVVPGVSLDALQKRLNLRRPVRLVESARFDSPAVIGVVRPVILFPIALLTDLTPREIELILVHELAHIARHDYLLNLLQVAIETLMFYHPAVWWLSTQLRKERENCCDDVAAAFYSDSREYAGALLAFEQRRFFTRSFVGMNSAMAASGGKLLNRVRRLVTANQPPHRSMSSVVAALMVLGGVTLLSAVAVGRLHAATSTQSTQSADTWTTTSSKQNTTEILPEDLQASTDVYRIADRDLIQVSVNEVGSSEKISRTQHRIDEKTGTVKFAKVGTVKVSGLTVTEAESAITAAFKLISERQSNFNVAINIVDNRGDAFTVSGKVERPGEYPLIGNNYRLRDALNDVGVMPDKSNQILVVRAPTVQNPRPRQLQIKLADLLSGRENVNIVIRAKDYISVIPVPSKADAPNPLGEYYIGGHVARPGVYSISQRGITLRQAVVAAGGPEPDVENAYVEIVRHVAGRETYPLVDGRYQDVLNGALPDIPLKPDDEIALSSKPTLPSTRPTAAH